MPEIGGTSLDGRLCPPGVRRCHIEIQLGKGVTENRVTIREVLRRAEPLRRRYLYNPALCAGFFLTKELEDLVRGVLQPCVRPVQSSGCFGDEVAKRVAVGFTD